MAQVDIMVREGLAYIGPTPPELWEQLVDATSYLPANAAHTRKRNPRVKLLRNSKCPVGLLDRVCRIIEDAGDTPVVDWTDAVKSKPPLHLKVVGVEPRDYQDEAAMAAMIYDRGIFRAPTGAGKTLIGALIIQTKAMHAVVIVPTIDLLHQYRNYLQEHLIRQINTKFVSRLTIGQLGDGVVDPQLVTVATMRTMATVLGKTYERYEYGEYDDKDDTDVSGADRDELRRWVDDIGTVIVDEAHILGAKTVFDVVTAIPAVAKYGGSASPWRDDGADLQIEAATGPLMFRIPTKRLVARGHLMAPHIIVRNTSSWWTPAAWGTTCARCKRQWLTWVKKCECGCKRFVSQFSEAYRVEIVENDLRNHGIARDVAELDRSTLVLVKQIEHGKRLEDTIPNSIFLSGRIKGERREQVYDEMRAGQRKVLICTTIADLGIDIPNLEALVLAGGGKSSTRHLQRIGRVVRPCEGKREPVVIDYDDSHIHSWFSKHAASRRKVEAAEWGSVARWTVE